MESWNKRFIGTAEERMKRFGSTLSIGYRLYKEDLVGSIAHVTALVHSDLLSPEEGEVLVNGLQSVLEDIESGKLEIKGDCTNIHSFIEIHLIERVGEVGKKLSIARNRKEQVAIGLRQFARHQAESVAEALQFMIDSLEEKGKAHPVILPDYAHVQRTEAVTFTQYAGAYTQMFKRDKKRIQQAIEMLNENPLGSGTLSATVAELDPQVTTMLLGFDKPVDNFLDGVDDRDYLVELQAGFSLIMLHMSRLSEDLIRWSRQEVRFITISDAVESIRHKTAHVYGTLFTTLTTLTSLPLIHANDRGDQQQFISALDTVLDCLQVMSDVIDTMEVSAS